ncbi:hypothetical protein SRHO_G00188180 [Serrasalmus rhombeus]
MNMLVSHEQVCRGPVQRSPHQVWCPIRAFMDGLMVTPHVSGSRWILKGLEEMMTWACMYFKSRSLILWPLRIYDVRISTIEGFQKKWLGLPRSLSNIALYGQNNKLTLPISSLSEEFKVSHAREVLQYRESEDPKISQAGIEVRTGVEVEGSRGFGCG